MIITLGFHYSSVYLSLVFDASSTIIYHRLKITYKTEQKLIPKNTSKPRPYRNLVLPRQFDMLITQKDFVCFEMGFDVAQANLKYTLYLEPLILLPPAPKCMITGTRHHNWFIQCWGFVYAGQAFS